MHVAHTLYTEMQIHIMFAVYVDANTKPKLCYVQMGVVSYAWLLNGRVEDGNADSNRR